MLHALEIQFEIKKSFLIFFFTQLFFLGGAAHFGLHALYLNLDRVNCQTDLLIGSMSCILHIANTVVLITNSKRSPISYALYLAYMLCYQLVLHSF